MAQESLRVVITGAAGVLGSAVARRLASNGAVLGLIDRAPQLGDSSSHPQCFIGGVDLTDYQQAKLAIDKAAATLGGIDALVNIAGGFRWETVNDGSIETWDFLYAINLKTAVGACKAVLGHLPSGRGRIVNVGAAAAAKAGAGMGAYAATKAGVSKLTEALAEELKDKGINVNAVLPSIIDTPANRKEMPSADFSRWVQPDALAEVIEFLLSPASRAVTGASILVAGRV